MRHSSRTVRTCRFQRNSRKIGFSNVIVEKVIMEAAGFQCNARKFQRNCRRSRPSLPPFVPLSVMPEQANHNQRDFPETFGMDNQVEWPEDRSLPSSFREVYSFQRALVTHCG
jgi:hypothetical protein